MKPTAFPLLLLLSLFSSYIASAQDPKVSITYGSTFDLDTGIGSFFGNDTKTLFDQNTKGLLSAGYFNDGFDVSAEVANVTDSSSLVSFLSNFNSLGSDSFNSPTSAGFFTANTTYIEQGKDKTAYLLALDGIDSYSNLSSATGIGLFRDASFDPLPAGSDGALPIEYSIARVSYDTIELGEAFLGELFAGTGNLYTTQAIPEPSTYALFFGIFSIGFVYWRKRSAKSASQVQS